MEIQEGITQRELDEYKEAFDLFDANGDKKICKDELGKVLRALGQNPTDSIIQEVMKKADKDGSNFIEYDEYIELLKGYVKDPAIVEIELGSPIKSLPLSFTGSNFIEYDEYIELLKGYVKDPAIVEIELREAFRVFDKDRNNNLNFGELRRALTHLGDPLTAPEAKELCSLMDANGDEKVDVEEFVKYMCKKW